MSHVVTQLRPDHQMTLDERKARLRQTFPWLAQDFELQVHPDGHEDSDAVCRHIEKVYHKHLTCEDPSYLRREMYRAIRIARTTHQGWRHDVRRGPIRAVNLAFPI